MMKKKTNDCKWREYKRIYFECRCRGDRGTRAPTRTPEYSEFSTLSNKSCCCNSFIRGNIEKIECEWFNHLEQHSPKFDERFYFGSLFSHSPHIVLIVILVCSHISLMLNYNSNFVVCVNRRQEYDGSERKTITIQFSSVNSRWSAFFVKKTLQLFSFSCVSIWRKLWFFPIVSFPCCFFFTV